MAATPVEISQLWRHLNRHVRALIRCTESGRHLPPLSFLLLRRIEESPGITLSELARCVGLSKSHASNMVEQLEKEGYVEKRSDPADQRVIRLHVTQAALRRFESLEEHATQVWTLVLEELPEAEVDDVERFFRSLLGACERALARVQATGRPVAPGEGDSVKGGGPAEVHAP